MDKFVSCWADGITLPENYVFPPGKRPGKHVIPSSKTIPVIDLSKAEKDDHTNIVHQIMEASQEFGFFQVINHGVQSRLMDDAMSVFNEFFKLPVEEKSRFCPQSPNRDQYRSQKCLLYTSNYLDYEKEEFHFWRDALKHSCNPLEECIQYWPQNPTTYREVAGEYTIKVRELGSRILEMICEGLGLEPGYFENELSHEKFLVVNHYPPCPDPSLTLGAGKHCDPNLITILLQGSVPGLQVFVNGEWISVEPIPDAFVVNIGHQLQIISNGKLRSVEHRAVTNAYETRTSATFFIGPKMNCLIQPAKALVSPENPPIYQGVHYEDFIKTFKEAYRGEIEDPLEPYMIKA